MRTVSPMPASWLGRSRTDRGGADVVLGPVEHRGERDDAGVFELPEGELGFGLGPVAGDDLGGGPVIMVGDQHVLAEELFFQGGTGGLVGAPGKAQVANF